MIIPTIKLETKFTCVFDNNGIPPMDLISGLGIDFEETFPLLSTPVN